MANVRCQRKKFQSNSKWTNPVSHPIPQQLHILQPDAAADAVMRPIGAGRGKIGRARIKLYFRRVMPETRQRAARMIPRRNEDDTPLFLFAKQFIGELRIFPGRAGLGFQFNRIRRHARRNQPPPVYFVIAQPADDDARRGVFLEKFRRAFRPFVRTPAQYHNHVGLHRPVVHAQKRLREKKRSHGQQQQQNQKAERGSFD